jgi:opacity protein-like surface antigen
VVDFGDPLGEFAASGSVEASSLAINGLYQFRPERAFRPYFGFGAGLAWLDVDVETLGEAYLDGRDDAPVLQLMGGVDIAMTERLDFRTEFRTWFAHPIEIDRPDGSPEDFWHLVHSVQIGLTYTL